MVKSKRYGLLLTATLGICLTSWQIARAYNKYQDLTKETLELQEDTIITSHDHLNTIRLHGKFIPNQLFIQPRSHQHQPGYHIWAPFDTSQGTILVSLGFHTSLFTPNWSSIHGKIYYLSAPPIRLNHKQSSKSPYMVGQLDIPSFEMLSNLKLEPFIITLDDSIELSISQVDDQNVLKHINYAAQFFLFALILCYYIATVSKEQNDNQPS